METISIRDLRGADLQQRARAGKPLAITNRRALIGVIIPASSAWVEHLVYNNWSRVRQSITEGEQAIAEGEHAGAAAAPVSGHAAHSVGSAARGKDRILALRPGQWRRSPRLCWARPWSRPRKARKSSASCGRY